MLRHGCDLFTAHHNRAVSSRNTRCTLKFCFIQNATAARERGQACGLPITTRPARSLVASHIINTSDIFLPVLMETHTSSSSALGGNDKEKQARSLTDGPGPRAWRVRGRTRREDQRQDDPCDKGSGRTPPSLDYLQEVYFRRFCRGTAGLVQSHEGRAIADPAFPKLSFECDR